MTSNENQEFVCHWVLLPLASVSKRVLAQNFSHENEFDLHENEHTDETYFHNDGFALVLRHRQRATRKWPINNDIKRMTRQTCLQITGHLYDIVIN